MNHAKALKQAELKRVLAVTAVGKHGQRNRLALLLSHYADLRLSEIASLQWDIRFSFVSDKAFARRTCRGCYSPHLFRSVGGKRIGRGIWPLLFRPD